MDDKFVIVGYVKVSTPGRGCRYDRRLAGHAKGAVLLRPRSTTPPNSHAPLSTRPMWRPESMRSRDLSRHTRSPERPLRVEGELLEAGHELAREEDDALVLLVERVRLVDGLEDVQVGGVQRGGVRETELRDELVPEYVDVRGDEGGRHGPLVGVRH